MENNRTTFDSLVSKMSQDERSALLLKMRPLEADPSESSFESEKNHELGDDVRIDVALKKEPFLYRLILWLRSMFSSTTSEEIYNEDRIFSLYKKLNRQFPGLVAFQERQLSGVFFEKLSELKKAADFFRPYINEAYSSLGAFYVFCGSLVAPEVTEQMNSEVDPNNLPLDRDVTNELRASLLRKMEYILKEISPEKRSALYKCAVSVEWLYQFTKLPFERFLAGFAGGAGGTQCARFETVSNELTIFSRIMCNGKSVPVQALEALYLFSADKIVVIESAAKDDDSRAKEFMDKAGVFMMSIHNFVKTVPLLLINKIAFNNIQWRAEQFSGAEDWFVRYKDQWKKLFDEQWSSWLKAKRKNKMNAQLKASFQIEEIPLLPDRPWAYIWDGVPFHFENTAGFLYWFISNKAHDSSEPLKTLLLEGQFAVKENKSEFSDALNTLDETSAAMYDMAESLSRTGQTRLAFDKVASDHLRTLPAQSKIDSLMFENESKIKKIKDDFCSSARSFQNILAGVFGEKKDSSYDGITNFVSIQGANNAEFREALSKSRQTFDAAFSILRELEQIDMPG